MADRRYNRARALRFRPCVHYFVIYIRRRDSVQHVGIYIYICSLVHRIYPGLGIILYK